MATRTDPPGTVRITIVVKKDQRQRIHIDAANAGLKVKPYILKKLGIKED